MMKQYNRKDNYLEQQKELDNLMYILQQNKLHYTPEHLAMLDKIQKGELEKKMEEE